METPDHQLRCPACRAQQPWQAQCRRCRADLQLLVAALRRSRFLVQQLNDDTCDLDGQRRDQYRRELRLLNPNALS